MSRWSTESVTFPVTRRTYIKKTFIEIVMLDLIKLLENLLWGKSMVSSSLLCYKVLTA